MSYFFDFNYLNIYLILKMITTGEIDELLVNNGDNNLVFRKKNSIDNQIGLLPPHRRKLYIEVIYFVIVIASLIFYLNSYCHGTRVEKKLCTIVRRILIQCKIEIVQIHSISV